MMYVTTSDISLNRAMHPLRMRGVSARTAANHLQNSLELKELDLTRNAPPSYRNHYMEAQARNFLADATDNEWGLTPEISHYTISPSCVMGGLARRVVSFYSPSGELVLAHTALATSLLRCWADAVVSAGIRFVVPHERFHPLGRAVRSGLTSDRYWDQICAVSFTGFRGLSLLSDSDRHFGWGVYLEGMHAGRCVPKAQELRD